MHSDWRVSNNEHNSYRKKEYGYELYNIWIRISISSLYNNVSKQKRNKKTKNKDIQFCTFTTYAQSQRNEKLNNLKVVWNKKTKGPKQDC
jgi:hypothetical protein